MLLAMTVARRFDRLKLDVQPILYKFLYLLNTINTEIACTVVRSSTIFYRVHQALSNTISDACREIPGQLNSVSEFFHNFYLLSFETKKSPNLIISDPELQKYVVFLGISCKQIPR